MGTYLRPKLIWIVLGLIGLVPLLATALGTRLQGSGHDWVAWLTLQILPRSVRVGLDVVGAALIAMAGYRLAARSHKSAQPAGRSGRGLRPFEADVLQSDLSAGHDLAVVSARDDDLP